MIILFLISVLTMYLLYKYNYKGLVYLIIFLLPFRVELFTIQDVVIRIGDFLSIVYILIWISMIALSKISRDRILIYSNYYLFIYFAMLSALISVLKFGLILNPIDILRLFLAIIIGISIASTMSNTYEIRRLFKFWLISATLSSAISIYIFLQNGYNFNLLVRMNNLNVQEFYQMKFSNTVFFSDPNNLASYLLISLFISFAIVKTEINVRKSKILIVVIQLIGLFLTLSRSAYISFVLTFFLYLLIYKNKKIQLFITKIIIFVLGVVVAFGLINFLRNDFSAMSRLGLWRTGINMTILNPLSGVGIGNSTLLFNQYIKESLIIYNPHFHNLYLTISSELGIIGLILFLKIIHKTLYYWRELNDKFYGYLFFGLISYLVQSLGVEYFESRHFWIFISLLYTYGYLKRKEL